MPPHEQPDRRVARSKVQLQRALASLMIEKPFDKITVNEIVERANVGRSTFYAHYNSKEDLFLSGHDAVGALIIGSFFAPDGSLRAEPLPEWVTFLEHIDQNREAHFFLSRGPDTMEIRVMFQKRLAGQIAERLRQHYDEGASPIAFAVLGQHVAVSMTWLMNWWAATRTPYSAQALAAMMHALNRAALVAALGAHEF